MVRPSITLSAACLALLAVPRAAQPAVLEKKTLQAWNQYIQRAEAGLKGRLNGDKSFLAIDDSPELRRRVSGGEIVVRPMSGDGRKSVAGGLIHDWIGMAFIPAATLSSVFEVVHDLDHYKVYYKPTVIDSKLLSHSGDEYRFTLRLLKKVLFVTAVIDGEFESRSFPIDEKRRYAIAGTKRVNEIQHYGEPEQRELPDGEGSGFVWRLYSIVKYVERDGGVYVELEAIGLSRDVPVLLRWLVNPVVSSLSRSALYTSLEQTREAVLKERGDAAPKP